VINHAKVCLPINGRGVYASTDVANNSRATLEARNKATGAAPPVDKHRYF